MVTLARSGNSAPRQRRGRNGLIGVSAKSGAPIGMIGPCAERLYAVDPAGVAKQDAVGDKLGEPLLAVDQHAQLCGLIGLAEQRDFIDGAMPVHAAGGVARAHQQWMDDADMGGGRDAR